MGSVCRCVSEDSLRQAAVDAAYDLVIWVVDCCKDNKPASTTVRITVAAVVELCVLQDINSTLGGVQQLLQLMMKPAGTLIEAHRAARLDSFKGDATAVVINGEPLLSLFSTYCLHLGVAVRTVSNVPCF